LADRSRFPKEKETGILQRTLFDECEGAGRILQENEAEVKNHYLGLDLSLTGAGIVVSCNRSPYPEANEMGMVEFQDIVGMSLEQDASLKEKLERQIVIAKAVIKVAREFMSGDNHLHVAIENYAFSTVQNAKGKSFQSSSQTGLAELRGVVVSQLWLACGIVPTLYSVKTARMVVFGDGNMEKSKIKPALNALGYNFKKSDDADAFVIAECHRRKMRGWKDERKKGKKRSSSSIG
jgi:Holliday junction resolvasome RuvABC endonuclease subunit